MYPCWYQTIIQKKKQQKLKFHPPKTEGVKKKKKKGLHGPIPQRVFSELYVFNQQRFFSWLYPPIS